MSKKTQHTEYTIVEPVASPRTLEEDIHKGFCTPPRQLFPKYLYDERGSQIFEKICSAPEYYLSRTEESILKEYADAIVAETQPEQIIELGSGTSRKTRVLLDACERQGIQCSYWPMDICMEIIESAMTVLSERYSWLQIFPLIGDYHAGLGNVKLPSSKRTLVLILGSTIGNMVEEDSIALLRDVRDLLEPGGCLLFGADRVKPKAILEAAYDDSGNLTQQFNFNMLNMLNRELNGNFNQDNFSYQAVYNQAEERVEMYLVSLKQQSIVLENASVQVELQAREKILTEISQKYTEKRMLDLLASSGLELKQHWISQNDYYSLLLVAKDG